MLYPRSVPSPPNLGNATEDVLFALCGTSLAQLILGSSIGGEQAAPHFVDGATRIGRGIQTLGALLQE